MKYWIVITLLPLLLVNGEEGCGCKSKPEYKIVKTKSGPVKGQKKSTMFGNKEYFAYKGIPYAKPPVGPLRFKPPQPHEKWKEPLDALEFGNSCPQIATFMMKKTFIEENCLFLNIYSPSKVKNMPVMFFIHGGGFIEGSGNDSRAGPDFLMNENVILVTMNYRLGALGFLSLGTPEYSGNMGLKDQLLALKWVFKNIKSFGGDPSKITIFGISAGGASTHMLTLTPQAKGFFQRAIIMSGCAFNPWALNSHNDHLHIIEQFAQDNGYSIKENNDLVNLLQTVDVHLLLKGTTPPIIDESISDRLGVDLYFVPVVEPSGTKNPIFTKKPKEYVNERYRQNIELMYGFTNGEGIPFVESMISDPIKLKNFNDKFLFKLPDYDAQFNNFDDPALVKARKAIRKHYFGKKKLSKKNINKIVDLASDMIFGYGIDTAVNSELNRKGPTFYYSFKCISNINLYRTLFQMKNIGIQKAAHGEDCCYIFYCRAASTLYDNLGNSSLERGMIKDFVTTFTNFAKHGKPKPFNYDIEWKPVQEGQLNIVEIENNKYIPRVNLFNDMRIFLDKTISEYKQAQEMNIKDEL